MHDLDQSGCMETIDTQAHRVAAELQLELDCADNELEALAAFHQEMAHQKQDSYVILEIDGVAALREVFVWWFDDDSALFVGWSDEETIATGVLAPGAVFHPMPLHEGKIPTVH